MGRNLQKYGKNGKRGLNLPHFTRNWPMFVSWNTGHCRGGNGNPNVLGPRSKNSKMCVPYYH